MNYLHLRGWYYQGESGEPNARAAFNKMQEGIKQGLKLPFECPYKIGLVHSSAPGENHWSVVVLIIRETQSDDSIEQRDKLNLWFEACGANLSGADERVERITLPSIEITLQDLYPNGHYKVVERSHWID